MKLRIFLILVVCLIATSCAACGPQKVLLPPGNETEFSLSLKEGDPTRIEFLADDGKVHSFDIDKGISRRYDRPEGAREYAVVTMLPNSDLEEWVTFHLLESKKPIWE